MKSKNQARLPRNQALDTLSALKSKRKKKRWKVSWKIKTRLRHSLQRSNQAKIREVTTRSIRMSEHIVVQSLIKARRRKSSHFLLMARMFQPRMRMKRRISTWNSQLSITIKTLQTWRLWSKPLEMMERSNDYMKMERRKLSSTMELNEKCSQMGTP